MSGCLCQAALRAGFADLRNSWTTESTGKRIANDGAGDFPLAPFLASMPSKQSFPSSFSFPLAWLKTKMRGVVL